MLSVVGMRIVFLCYYCEIIRVTIAKMYRSSLVLTFKIRSKKHSCSEEEESNFNLSTGFFSFQIPTNKARFGRNKLRNTCPENTYLMDYLFIYTPMYCSSIPKNAVEVYSRFVNNNEIMTWDACMTVLQFLFVRIYTERFFVIFQKLQFQKYNKD